MYITNCDYQYLVVIIKLLMFKGNEKRGGMGRGIIKRTNMSWRSGNNENFATLSSLYNVESKRERIEPGFAKMAQVQADCKCFVLFSTDNAILSDKL
jgi:hypothetical protein